MKLPFKHNLRLRFGHRARIFVTLGLLSMNAIAQDPVIQIQPPALDFGNVPVGQTGTLFIQILNRSEVPLIILGINNGNPRFTFVAPAAPFNIPPLGAQPVMVSFAPIASGAENDALVIKSDNPVTPQIQVPLTGAADPQDDVPPIVTVTGPLADETFLHGQTISIRVNAADDLGVARIDIDATRDGGATFEPVANNLRGDTNLHNWPGPGDGSTAQWAVRVRGTDAAGNAGIGLSQPFTIRPSLPPVAIPGGPYVIDFGQEAQLDGSASLDPDASCCGDSIVDFAWDIDNNGQFDDATGASPKVPWQELLARGLAVPTDPITDLPRYPILLRVTDSFGRSSTGATELRIFVSEPLPHATVSPSPVACNQPVTCDASGSTHPHPDRTIVRYEWDFEYRDAIFDCDAIGPVVTHLYSKFGVRTVALRVTDDSAPAQSRLTTVTVNVNLGNLAPTARAGGPYNGVVGAPLTLDAGGSNDPDKACGDRIVSFAWDLNNDGIDDVRGANPTFPWLSLASLDPPLLYPADEVSGLPANAIRLKVTDSLGQSATVQTDLRLFNPPRLDIEFAPPDLVLTAPLWARDFGLQAAPALSDSIRWREVNAPALNGSDLMWRFPVTFLGSSGYFRLVQPWQDCPLPSKQMLPTSANLGDAPFARRGPLPAHPESLLPDPQGRRGSRYQQLWSKPFEHSVRIGAIAFRLDGNRPLSGYHGDLTWQVDVRLGTTPLAPAGIQSAFADNVLGAEMRQVYRGFLVLAGTGQGQGPTEEPQLYFPSQAAVPAELLRIELGTPFPFDPSLGNLLLEVNVDGVSGDDFDVLFDAVNPGLETASVWSQLGPEAASGATASGGAVVQFDVAPEWPVPTFPALARRCLDSLALAPADAEALRLTLEDAGRMARAGRLGETGEAITRYFAQIDELQKAGAMSLEDAQLGIRLGEQVGVGLRAAPAVFERMAAHLVGTGMGYPLFILPGAIRNMSANALQYTDDADRERLQALMDDVDDIGGRIFDDREIQPIEQAEYDEMFKKLCDVVDDLQKHPKVPDIWKQVFRDLKTILKAQGHLTFALASLKSIFEDGDIDREDRGALRSLKGSLEAILELLESDGLLHELLEGLLKLVCQLLDSVVSGDLVDISSVDVFDKTYLYINVTEAVELRLIRLFIPKELLDKFPIDIPIGLDSTVKKDLTVRFCPIYNNDGKPKGVDIEFTPPDAFDLDLDLDIPFAVEILEALSHIPDLDHFCIKHIKIVDGMIVIEAVSDGKEVRIEVKNGKVEIFVGGKKVYPE